MAGGPLLQLCENLLPFAKDLRIRFALAMLGNVLAILFIFSLSKMFIPGLEEQLFNCLFCPELIHLSKRLRISFLEFIP